MRRWRMDTGHEDGRQQGNTFVYVFPYFGDESGKNVFLIIKYRFASVGGNFQLS